MDTKFDMNVSNEMVLSTAKSYVFSFYQIQVIKEKPKEGAKITHSPPFLPRVDLRGYHNIKK